MEMWFLAVYFFNPNITTLHNLRHNEVNIR